MTFFIVGKLGSYSLVMESKVNGIATSYYSIMPGIIQRGSMSISNIALYFKTKKMLPFAGCEPLKLISIQQPLPYILLTFY